MGKRHKDGGGVAWYCALCAGALCGNFGRGEGGGTDDTGLDDSPAGVRSAVAGRIYP